MWTTLRAWVFVSDPQIPPVSELNCVRDQVCALTIDNHQLSFHTETNSIDAISNDSLMWQIFLLQFCQTSWVANGVLPSLTFLFRFETHVYPINKNLVFHACTCPCFWCKKSKTDNKNFSNMANVYKSLRDHHWPHYQFNKSNFHATYTGW